MGDFRTFFNEMNLKPWEYLDEQMNKLLKNLLLKYLKMINHK